MTIKNLFIKCFLFKIGWTLYSFLYRDTKIINKLNFVDLFVSFEYDRLRTISGLKIKGKKISILGGVLILFNILINNELTMS